MTLVPRGTPIAVVAPASRFDPERLEAGLALARARGHDLQLLPGLAAEHRYLAGTDDHRLDHLVEALTSPRYGAVWAARGGYGVTRLLDRLPWADLRPRPVLGFSDLTPLLEALQRRVGSPTLHAPVVHSLPQHTEASLDHLFALLEGRPTPPLRGDAWVPGEAEGPLRGGNLCLLAATCGTPWQLEASGALLVLEEVGEAPYRVDRYLQQLRQAGVLDGVRGVLLGEFLGCEAPSDASWSLRDVLLDHLTPLGVPVLAGLPIGHGRENHAFPVGQIGRLHGETLTWGDSL